MKKFRIGRHINISGGFLTAPAFAEEIGCEFIQIFLGNPQQMISPVKPNSDLIAFGTELKIHHLKAVIHGHYTINLARNPANPKLIKSIKSLVNDIKSAHIIGKRCIGVIIHMGKNMPDEGISTEQSIQNYINGLQQAIAQTKDIDTPIILETGAGTGNEIGSDLNDLHKIYSGLNTEQKQRIKFCIDTCHIWSAGYNIGTENGVKAFFKVFDQKFSIKNIACIHLNNSQNDLGAHVDRHADLSYGKIPQIGMKKFVQIAFKHRIPIIMETPLDSPHPKTNKDIQFKDELLTVKKWISSN